MRRVTDVNYELLLRQGEILFAHRNHLIPFNPVVPHLEELVQHYKTASFNPHTTISSFNPADDMLSPEQSTFHLLENSDKETTPDFVLTDRHHT